MENTTRAQDIRRLKPYPGLRAFRREEYPLFFGRDNCLDKMIASLEDDRFLAVIGPSGNGKSSLVRAAFFHELELGLAEKAGTRWQFADIAHPARTTPFEQFARALLVSRPGYPADEEPDSAAVKEFSNALEGDPFALLDWTEDPDNLAPGHNLLILVDQFEELYTYDSDTVGNKGFNREHVARFIRLLLDMIERNDSQHIYIVITMRAEHLNLCTTFPGLAERFSADAVIPPRMSRDQWRSAIEGPANYLNLVESPNAFTIEPDLTEQLLNDLSAQVPVDPDAQVADRMEILARQADQLPLLQHVLNGLWQEAYDRHLSDGGPIVLKRSAYLREGYGLKDTLTRRGKEELARLDDTEKELVRRIFRALVDGPSVSRAYRRSLTIKDLIREADFTNFDGSAPSLELEKDVRRLVDQFRDDDVCFLTPIRIDATAPPLADDDKISISHESLIRQWEELQNWFAEEIRDQLYWEQIKSLLGRKEEGLASMERALHRWEQFRGQRVPSIIWRGLQLRDIRKWWEGTKASDGNELADRRSKSAAARRAFPPASPYPGWVSRYVARDQFRKASRRDGNDGIATTPMEIARAEYGTARQMFDLSKRREKRLKFLGRASAGVLALALVGSAFLFQEASTAKRETEKAKNEAARAQVDAEKLESQANNFRKNAQESRRDARIALKEANRLKREARDDKRKAELATRASIQARASAEQATERAQLADSASKRSQQTVTIAKRALASSTLKQIESYNRDGQGDEDPASREGYDRLVSALAALGPKYSYSVEERGKIADVHLNALNHAVSQLDPAFLMDAIRNAEIVLANPAIEGDELRQRRLKLGKARLLLWDGSAENVIAASKLYAEVSDAAGPQPADPENQRLKMIAETGRAEIALQANVQNPPAPQCFDVRDTDDASSVVRSEIIRRVVARTRCLQMQGRLKSVQADAISSFDDTSTWLSRLPTLIRQDTRIKREEANTFLIYGDTLTKLLTPEQTVIRARSRQAQQAYFKAISPLRNGPDRIITLAATTDFPSGDLPDSPADTPFHRYALIDVQNMVRSRIRNAQSIATWTLADATEPDVGMAQVDWTRSRGRLAPAARAASYLVSQANRQQSVGDPPDIHDYRKNLRSLLSDGAGIAVKLYGRREGRSGEEPHYGFDNMADTIAVSLSFARDALLLKVSPKSEGGAVIVPRTPPLRTARVQPPRADTSKPAAKKKFLFGLLGGTRKVENQQFPDAPTPERPAIPEGLEDVYKSINALGSIIGNLDDERGFQTNFLDYIPDESATSLPPISDARKLDRLEGIASEICAFDSDLASLCSSVENLKGKIDATRNRYSLKTVNSDDVWTDRRGIALGGIDVVACFDDVAKEESATNFDDEEEDSFVAFLRTKKGVKGLPIPPEKNSKRVPRSQTCELKYGNLAFSEERSGVIWLFESAGNRNKFRAAGSITKYLPFAKGFELTSYLDGKSDEYEFYRKEQGREFNVSGRIFNGRLYLKAFDAGEE